MPYGYESQYDCIKGIHQLSLLSLQTSAEIIWEGRDEPLIFLDTLREANLMVLEGMRNGKLLTFLPSFHELFSK